MKYCVFILFASFTSFAQCDYEKSAKEYLENLKQAEITEFKTQNKYKVLNWLPSFGYDALRNSPIVTFSFSQVKNSLDNNATRKAKLQSIELKYTLLQQETRSEIVRLLQKIYETQSLMTAKGEIRSLEEEKLKMYEELYKLQKITPEQLINQKIKMKQIDLELITQQLELNNMYRKLQEISHCQ